MEEGTLKEKLISLIFFLSSLYAAYVFTMKFFQLQYGYFDGSRYLLFIAPGFALFITGLSFAFLSFTIGIVLVCRYFEWPQYIQSYKATLKVFIFGAMVVVFILTFNFFSYVYITEAGLYQNRYLSLGEEFLSWDNLEEIEVGGYYAYRGGPSINYTLVFNDGHKINLFDTPTRENLLIKVSSIDRILESHDKVKLTVNKGDYEDIKSNYTGKELVALKQIFNVSK